MPIFQKDGVKILFIHIPKTGGTSIENWLKTKTVMSFFSTIIPSELMVSPQHLQISVFKVLFGDNWWNSAFTIVRNPYDRIESEYFWRTDEQFKQSEVRPDFSTWVVNNIRTSKQNPFHLDNHLRPQTDFIDNDVKIYKFEAGFTQIVQDLSNCLGIELPIKFNKVNSSNRKKVHWSTEALNIVNSHYANDFHQLGYELSNSTLSHIAYNTHNNTVFSNAQIERLETDKLQAGEVLKEVVLSLGRAGYQKAAMNVYSKLIPLIQEKNQIISDTEINISFNIGLYQDGYLMGWILDKSYPLHKLVIELYCIEGLIGKGVADQFRQDLADAEIGDGYCSFRIKVDSEHKNFGDQITIRVVNYNKEFAVKTSSIKGMSE